MQKIEKSLLHNRSGFSNGEGQFEQRIKSILSSVQLYEFEKYI